VCLQSLGISRRHTNERVLSPYRRGSTLWLEQSAKDRHMVIASPPYMVMASRHCPARPGRLFQHVPLSVAANSGMPARVAGEGRMSSQLVRSMLQSSHAAIEFATRTLVGFDRFKRIFAHRRRERRLGSREGGISARAMRQP
jgi:hypothetical protein